MELYFHKKVDSYHSPHKSCIAKYRDTGISYAYIWIYIKKNEQLLISIPNTSLGSWDPSMRAVYYHGVHPTRWGKLCFVLLGKIYICRWHLSKWCWNDIKTVLIRFLNIHWSYFTSGRAKLRQSSQENSITKTNMILNHCSTLQLCINDTKLM